MGVSRIGTVSAMIGILLPVASQAAVAAIGTISGGSAAFVARDGAVIPATAGMRLFTGDRIITRAGGNASVRMANNCSASIPASSMLLVSTATCGKPSVSGFDEGRAGYVGRSSAFLDQPKSLWALDAALVAVWAGGTYFIMHHGHHHHDNTPTSP